MDENIYVYIEFHFFIVSEKLEAIEYSRKCSSVVVKYYYNHVNVFASTLSV